MMKQYFKVLLLVIATVTMVGCGSTGNALLSGMKAGSDRFHAQNAPGGYGMYGSQTSYSRGVQQNSNMARSSCSPNDAPRFRYDCSPEWKEPEGIDSKLEANTYTGGGRGHVPSGTGVQR